MASVLKGKTKAYTGLLCVSHCAISYNLQKVSMEISKCNHINKKILKIT